MFSNYILILGLSGIYANGCHDGAKKDICGANGPYIPHLLTRGPDIDVTVELFKTEYCDVYAIDLGQWYHSNIPMTNTCPDAYMCGTKFPIWLQGENPIENEGVVNLTACLRDFDECCLRTYRISAVNCGVTMAYCFHELPSGCHQRYCFGIKDSFTNHDQKLASSKTPMKTSEHKQTSTALRSTGTSHIVPLLHSPSNEESNQQTTDVPLTSSGAQSERSTNPMYILTKSTPRGNGIRYVEDSSLNPEQILPSRKTPMETSKDKQTSTALRSSGSDFRTTHIAPLIHSPSNSNEEPDQQTTNDPLKSTIAQKSTNPMYRLTNTTPRGNDVEDSSANFDQTLPSSKTSMETSEAKQTSTALRSAGSDFRTSHIVPFIHSPSNEEPNQQTTDLPFKSAIIEQSEQSTNPMYTLINTRPRGNGIRCVFLLLSNLPDHSTSLQYCNIFRVLLICTFYVFIPFKEWFSRSKSKIVKLINKFYI